MIQGFENHPVAFAVGTIIAIVIIAIIEACAP